MNRAILLPALLSIAFLCAGFAELLVAPPPIEVSMPRIARAASTVAPVRAANSGQEGETILARPLFTADRRPASAKSSAVASKTPPRLSAILISANAREVLFDGAATADDPEPNRAHARATLTIR